MNRNGNRMHDLLCALVPPVLMFAALDTLLGTRYFSQPYWPSYYYFLFVGGAFAAEQLMTVVSGWVFRGFILSLVLGYPSRNLLIGGSRGILGMLFPEYYAAMPAELAARLKAKFSADGINGMEAQYLHAMAKIQGRTDMLARIDSLNAETVFAQNLSLVAAVTFAVSAMAGASHSFTLFAGAAFVIGFYRFLRVLRAHALELYLAYDNLAGRTFDKPAQRRDMHAV